jgi:hypothetical protein
MLINSKITPVHSMTDVDSIAFPCQLLELVALKASIPVLGLWVLLCNQQGQVQHNKVEFCQKYHISTHAFDKTMAKLAELNLVWRQHSIGNDDWHVANLPKELTNKLQLLLSEMESLLVAEQLQAKQPPVDKKSAIVEFHNRSNGLASAKVQSQQWESLKLGEEFFQIAATKIPQELVNQYWDSFIAGADKRAEVVPEKKLLFKKWKAYIANVSVNLAVSERRFSNNIERKAKQNSQREQNNINAWQLLMDQRIPQELSFSAAINNLAAVENDVWHGFIQQNMRYKNEIMNPTNLQYAFEEYCKTSGQKFLRKSTAPESELDEQLNDTSWANNLDDVL